ncbi:TPA: polysaccharide pyruvyl transferase family protein [Vibrio vulnificus]|nr:polysaccharide pyruvyl transferase family protein [Vibrio vulnificus]
MKKIGICTVTTGFNYGSSLQAYATKKILSKLGYEPELIKLKGGLIEGRDIRINKTIVMFFRTILYRKSFRNLYAQYFKSKKNKMSETTKSMFFDFSNKQLNPQIYSWNELKKISKEDSYAYFLCGSDQVWNGDAMYVDPLYYLEFAPINKRVAFSPSFGRKDVAGYNKKNIAKKISKIRKLSVREDSGCEIIKNLTGRDSVSLIDPTLVISKDEWNRCFDLSVPIIKEPYVFAYFLDEPSLKAREYLKSIKELYSIKVIAAPYNHTDSFFDDFVDAGPIEFLKLVYNAKYVVTDSFHGTAFSLNFNIPFSTFERNYGKTGNQSSRIISLLEKVGEIDRFETYKLDLEKDMSNKVGNVLNIERDKSIQYLLDAFEK